MRDDHEIAPGKGHVDVAPGAGFGTLLPRETITRTVLWRPTAPVPTAFELVLKVSTRGGEGESCVPEI